MQWHFNLIKLVLCGCLLVNASAFATVYVIANKGVSISKADIKDVFTGEKEDADGTKLIPYANSSNSVHSEFLTKFLGMDASKFKTVWQKKSFRDGKSQPELKSDDADVLKAVKSNPGAVGYVSQKPDDSVKIIATAE